MPTKAGKLTKAEKEAEIRKISRTCRGVRSDAGTAEVSKAFEEGNVELAQAMDSLHREPCGYDINALILEYPLDGEEKEAPCPGCGRVVTWTPAPLDLVKVSV